MSPPSRLFLLALLLGVLAPAAAAAEVPWTVRTAANNLGADRPNYRYTVDPGGRLGDGIVVANHGSAPLRLALYAADGFTNDAGALDLVTKDVKSTGVGAWVHPAHDHVTVGPGESVDVPFAIRVPASAEPGDYLGGIVTSHPEAGGVDRRVGIRIRLRVGGALTPRLSVERVHVRYSETANPFGKGDATVTYTIHNVGNAILSARQRVSAAGPFGRFAVGAGRIADSPQLLPGETWKVSVPLHGVAPALRLTANVTLVPLLTDAAGSTAPLQAVGTSTRAWTIAWRLVLLVVVVLGALVAAGLVVRYRHALALR